jgi:ATP-dependent RNA helicase HrpB
MVLAALIVDNPLMHLPDLPITDALPQLLRALGDAGLAVLQAPPGAGKTTVVPLAMLDDGLVAGRILMLEPRRLAARAAAERMAETLGETVGATVGYRIRGQARIGKTSRIEVVTEGILTRMIQSDPSLSGIGAVIFDEFHERSLNADLGLALVVEARAALRPDLLVLVMSATLDAAPVADMLGAPVVTSLGRAFPVQTHWLERPVPKSTRFEAAMADLIVRAAGETDGSILAFLPGEGEIRRVEAMLKSRLPTDISVHPLFGAMAFRAQRAAIAPAAAGRKLVLATAIAETSLTIADIGVVVDGGLARRARFDPGSGMSRLVTETASKAEAEQRRGRAGRVAAGVCYRLWTRGQDGARPAFAPAEIECGDLSGLVLDLALWGARGTDDMAFVSAPGAGAFAKAQALLHDLGALDSKGAITGHGRKLASLPVHPRLGHMLVLGGRDAPLLAAILAERDPLRAAPVDLALRLAAVKNPARFSDTRGPVANRATVERIRAEAARLSRNAGPEMGPGLAALAALAYPDRVGLHRPGDAPKWVLSGGKGAVMDAADPMAGARLIVATDLDGAGPDARIRQAIDISQSDLRAVLGQRIEWINSCQWSTREGRILARQREHLGALVLQDRRWKDAPPEALAHAALEGVRELGLPISGAAHRFCARVELARNSGIDLPSMAKADLLDDAETWLLPYLAKVRTAADIKALDLSEPLRQRLDWQQMKTLERVVPANFTTPTGRRIAIDYATESPTISLRLQEMFGVTSHPAVAGRPLRVTLLSPAGRALQTTMDIPAFWTTSYHDVRKDMRGRYPKHPWPEDPTQAAPTLRAKPRNP